MVANNFRAKYKELEKRYRKLQKEYILIKRKYKKIKKRAKILRKKLEKEYPSYVSSLFLLTIGTMGLLYFRNLVIIELGLIGFFADLIWELYGTQKGWWGYKKSKIFMIRKVPIEIPFLVFTLGMAGAAIIMFLLQFF